MRLRPPRYFFAHFAPGLAMIGFLAGGALLFLGLLLVILCGTNPVPFIALCVSVWIVSILLLIGHVVEDIL
jgi:hypothetical protein